MKDYQSLIDESQHRLSQKLGLDWVYDWSNPRMKESTFIRAVLQQGRFEDTLKVTAHFGIARMEEELAHMRIDDYGANTINRAQGIIYRIKKGYQLALESEREHA